MRKVSTKVNIGGERKHANLQISHHATKYSCLFNTKIVIANGSNLSISPDSNTTMKTVVSISQFKTCILKSKDMVGYFISSTNDQIYGTD